MLYVRTYFDSIILGILVDLSNNMEDGMPHEIRT
jgi:hypothetical protein